MSFTLLEREVSGDILVPPTGAGVQSVYRAATMLGDVSHLSWGWRGRQGPGRLHWHNGVSFVRSDHYQVRLVDRHPSSHYRTGTEQQHIDVPSWCSDCAVWEEQCFWQRRYQHDVVGRPPAVSRYHQTSSNCRLLSVRLHMLECSCSPSVYIMHIATERWRRGRREEWLGATITNILP